MKLLLLLFPLTFSQGISHDIVRKNIVSMITDLRKCYQDSVNKHNKIYEFNTIFHFTIGSDGKVTKFSADHNKSDSLQEEAISCFKELFLAHQFPKLEGGGQVEINQPMNFYPRTPSKNNNKKDNSIDIDGRIESIR